MLIHNQRTRIKWTRWLRAQKYEEAFWRRCAADMQAGTTGQLDWYHWKARQLEQHLALLLDPTPPAGRVLEIGSGPIGIINALGWGDRYAIDPLEPFYRQTSSLIELRKPDVTYLTGTGEALPFDDASFDLVIIDNVIDHTYEPARILQETCRVLAPSGHLYLTVNVHTTWGALLHAVLAALHIDRGHPYTFTPRGLRRLLSRHCLAIVREEIEDYVPVARANRRSASITDKIKGYTGLSEFQHMVLCRQTGRPSTS